MNTQAKRRAGMSANGLGYLVVAVAIVVGVPLLLLSTGAIWAQIVAGIFIAILVVPWLILALAWLVVMAYGPIRNAEHKRNQVSTFQDASVKYKTRRGGAK